MMLCQTKQSRNLQAVLFSTRWLMAQTVCVVRRCHDDSAVNNLLVLPQRRWCKSTRTHTYTRFHWWKQIGVVSSRLMPPLGVYTHSTHRHIAHWQILLIQKGSAHITPPKEEKLFQEPLMEKEQQTVRWVRQHENLKIYTSLHEGLTFNPTDHLKPVYKSSLNTYTHAISYGS